MRYWHSHKIYTQSTLEEIEYCKTRMDELVEICKKDDVEALEAFLIETGNCDVTIQYDHGLLDFLTENPPLISVAAFFSAEKCFEHLVVMGATLDKPDDIGRLPVHFAACGGSLEICDQLDSAGADFTPHDSKGMGCVHYACLFGHHNILARMDARGLPLDEPGENGLLPVHYAAKAKSKEAMEYLLDHGCDMNANVNGQTPFLIAFWGSENVMRLLLERKADTNVIVGEDRTPLMEACYRGDLAMVKLFLEFKTEDIDCADKKLGWTPLLYAVSLNCVKVVKYLVENGADVNKTSLRGFSPAMAAHNNGLKKIEEFLLEHGAVYRPE